MTFGFIIDRLQYLIDDTSSETLVDLKRSINAKYIGIGSLHMWNLLENLVEGQGTVLPSDLQTIMYVEDNTDYLYFRRGLPQRYGNVTLYNYFMNLTQATPVIEVNDAVVVAGDKTVTSATATFTATHVGEYIRIGENTGRYKIDSLTSATEIELVEAFRGDSATAQHLEVRPRGTQKLAFTDEEGAELTSSTIKMWYLRKPLPLYNRYDEIMLPGNCEALVISVLQDLNLASKYDNDARKLDGIYNTELNLMKALSPVPDRYVRPRGADGRPFIFGRQGLSDSESIHTGDIATR